MLIRGNVAKLFCLEQIDQVAIERQDGLRLLDLGCGTAINFIPLLRKHPHVHYMGWDPDQKAIELAQGNLAGFNAEVHHGLAYEVRLESAADIVVSFSAFEHVLQRKKFLATAKANLAIDGLFFINYDAGHFFLPPVRSFWANQRNLLANSMRRIIRNILNSLADGKFDYQSFVTEKEFRGYLDEVGLKILDAKMFNTSLKSVFKIVPEESKDAFMRKWLEVELWINSQGISYDDSLASNFMSRNFILTHA